MLTAVFSITKLAGEVTVLFPAQRWHCADAHCLVNRDLYIYTYIHTHTYM